MNSPGKSKLFYGYYIVGACFTILFFLWGMVLNTFPVFVVPITEDLDWSRGQLSVASLMGAIGSTLLAPIAGKLIDRVGARPVMTAGTLAIGIPLLAGSLATQLWHMYIIFFLAGCGIMCATIIPCSFIISNWFVSRRASAMAVAFVGTACGGMVMAPVANWIIRNYSWRHAFAIAGIEVLVIVIPIIYFVIRNRPSEKGLEPYKDAGDEAEAEIEAWGVSEREAFAMPAFWLIAAIILIGAIVTGGLGYHFVAFLTDLGHADKSATFAWVMVMGFMILGKLAAGRIADHWGSKNTMAAAYVIFSISIAMLVFAESYSVVLAFAVVYGFSLGAPLILNPLLTGDYFGMKNFGSIFGILSIGGTVGGAVGPIIAGYYFDNHDTYMPVFYAFIALMAVGTLCAIAVRPTPQQVGATAEPQPANITG